MTWEGRLEPGQDLEGLCITMFEFAWISKDSEKLNTGSCGDANRAIEGILKRGTQPSVVLDGVAGSLWGRH